MRTVLTIMLLAATAFAHTEHGEATGPSENNAGAKAADDDWGDVEEAAPTAAVEPAATAPRTGVKAIVGYFHAATTHMPIGFVMLLFALDALCLFGRQRALYKAGYVAMFLALASFAPAIISGLVRFSNLGLTGHDAEHALEHRNFMLAAAGMMLVAVLTRLPARDELVGTRRYLYVGFLAATVVLLTIGGHEGGEMVYGDIPDLS